MPFEPLSRLHSASQCQRLLSEVMLLVTTSPFQRTQLRIGPQNLGFRLNFYTKGYKIQTILKKSQEIHISLSQLVGHVTVE